MVGGFILRRMLAVLPLLWFIWTLVFIVGHLVPGRGDDLYSSPLISRQSQEHMRQVYGLDQPLPEQYARQLLATLRGDLAVSTASGRPVTEILRPAIAPTLLLAGSALALQFILGTALGAWAAVRSGRTADHVISYLALILHSLPIFWLGILLMMFFSLYLGWLPPSHMSSPAAPAATFSARLVDLLTHLALPLTTLTLAGLAVVIRHARSSLLEVLTDDTLQAARARGLPEWRLVWRHGMRQAILPLITLLGLALPLLLSGSLLVEVVFSWPGLGQVAYQAILGRDFPVVQATTLLVATLVVFGNLAADTAISLIDPRTRVVEGQA
jgi:peptide/nickel transport system permease protein